MGNNPNPHNAPMSPVVYSPADIYSGLARPDNVNVGALQVGSQNSFTTLYINQPLPFFGHLNPTTALQYLASPTIVQYSTRNTSQAAGVVSEYAAQTMQSLPQIYAMSASAAQQKRTFIQRLFGVGG